MLLEALFQRYDMNGRYKMQGGKNWPKEMNANRFFWNSHWLEIWSNHLCPSMGPNGGSVAMDSVRMNAYLTGSRAHENRVSTEWKFTFVTIFISFYILMAAYREFRQREYARPGGRLPKRDADLPLPRLSW